MKKALVVLLVVVGSLAICAPALAWPASHIPWWHPVRTFTCTGKTKTVDVGASQLVVGVRLASRGVKDYLGDDLTVTITSHTHLLRANGRMFKGISLGDIQAGDRAHVVGVIDRSTPGSPQYVAMRIVVRHVALAANLTRFACSGPVKAVDAAGGGITIHLDRVTRALWMQLGGDLACSVADNATIVRWTNGQPTTLTLADVSVGDHVVAQGSIDRSDPVNPLYTVTWMRVRTSGAATQQGHLSR
jgi:hypothetical protein